MKLALLSVMAMLGSAFAAPVSLNKRSLPRLGGVNIAVSCLAIGTLPIGGRSS